MDVTLLNFMWEMVNLNERCPFPGMPTDSLFCTAPCVPKVLTVNISSVA
jgi:hypothetical protein